MDILLLYIDIIVDPLSKGRIPGTSSFSSFHILFCQICLFLFQTFAAHCRSNSPCVIPGRKQNSWSQQGRVCGRVCGRLVFYSLHGVFHVGMHWALPFFPLEMFSRGSAVAQELLTLMWEGQAGVSACVPSLHVSRIHVLSICREGQRDALPTASGSALFLWSCKPSIFWPLPLVTNSPRLTHHGENFWSTSKAK